MTRVDPVVVARAPTHSGHVIGYRNQTPGYNAGSGDGVRRNGGRFNPPQSFAVVYLCSTRACAVAELTRQAARQGLRPDALLPRELWRLEANLDFILDLTDENTRSHLGISFNDVVSDDFEITQQLGEATHEHGFQAIRSPSATGVDIVIAVFPENLGSTLLDQTPVETWQAPGDLSLGGLDEG